MCDFQENLVNVISATGSNTLSNNSHVLLDISNQQNVPVRVSPQNFVVKTIHNITEAPIDLSTIDNDALIHSSVKFQNSDGSICEVVGISTELVANNVETVKSEAINVNADKAVQSREQNYIYQILKAKDEGPFMIYLYDFESNEENLENLIDNKKRTFFSIAAVCKCIVWHEFRRTNCYEISPTRLDELAESIVQLFPRYLKTTIYSKPTQTENAHGALYSAYDGIREKLIATKYTKPYHRKRKVVDTENIVSSDLQELMVSVELLDHPYVDKWKCTAPEEKKEFFRNNDLQTILKTFPNLTKPVGYTLIQADFYSTFEKPSDIFSKNWSEVAPKIIKFAKSKRHDKQLREILHVHEVAIKENCELVALYLLPFLFKKIIKQTVRSKSGKNWYPEKEEILSTFILHIKNTHKFSDALAEATANLKRMHTDHKLIVRPYVVICGTSFSSITSAYVIVADHTYQVHSGVLAVDICFQFMKVLHEPYPHVCCHVWQFLECLVYKFPLTNLYKNVSELIESLNNMR